MTWISVRNRQRPSRRRQGPHLRVLDEISTEISAGEFLCIIAPSECGKTKAIKAGSLQAGLHGMNEKDEIDDVLDVVAEFYGVPEKPFTRVHALSKSTSLAA